MAGVNIIFSRKKYCKVAKSSMSLLVAHRKFFKMLMKENVMFIYFDLLEKIDFCNMYESLLLATLHTAKRS